MATPIPRLLAAALAAAAIGAALAAGPATGVTRPAGDRVPGQVIVGLTDGGGVAVRAAVQRRTGVLLGRTLTARGARLGRVGGAGSIDRAIARLEADPAVRWAEPNLVHHGSAAPDDPLFGSQWGLLNSGQPVGGVTGAPGADIDVVPAWEITTGSPRVRVAVVDSGVDGTLPDLAANIARNPGESGDGREANGVDDDGDGLVDDWRGWDFVDDDADPQDGEPHSHGTAVAGIIAARGNDDAGLAGVTWSSSVIPVRALDADGAGTTADLAAAITHAASRGARILNASFGGPRSSAIAEAIAASPNMLVVTAAGNDGADAEGPRGAFPCALTLENVVCVAATGQSDELARFSNRGDTSVDLAAPGERILGLQRGGGAGLMSGTSFAAPHVAGVAALVLAADPSASTRQLRGALLAGVHPLPGLAGAVATGGRLDALGALARVPPAQPGPGATSGPVTDVAGSGARLTGIAPASAQRLSYYFEYGSTTAYGEVTPTRPLPPGEARAVSESLTRLPAGAPLHARLVVAGIGGVSAGADVSTTVPVTPAAAAPGGAAAAIARTAGRPGATVRRAGRVWFVSLRLGEFSLATGLLERRRAPAVRHRVAYTVVRGLRRRGLAAGTRRIALGRLRPGRHRLRLTITGAHGRVTLIRGFTVHRP